MKECKKCNETKVITEFYKKKAAKDGHDGQCKSCVNMRNKTWQKKNPEAANAVKKAYKERNRDSYLAQQREYAMDRYRKNIHANLKENETDHVKKSKRKYYEKNRVKINARLLKRYHSSQEVKDKMVAHRKVAWAVKTGKLVSPKQCENCLEERKLDAHHDDYSKPLEVIWICRKCHRREHSKYLNKE